jgi:hypothetical protein
MVLRCCRAAHSRKAKAVITMRLWFADLQAGYLFEVVLVVGIDRGYPFFQTPVAHDRVGNLYLIVAKQSAWQACRGH